MKKNWHQFDECRKEEAALIACWKQKAEQEVVPMEQNVVAQYNSMKSEVRQLAEKMAELQAEIAEHDRVIMTLQGLPSSRKAFRMIGGVLIERTVEEVLPAVTLNRNGVAQVLEQLNANIQQKEAAANELQVEGCFTHTI
ncbi:unnamed protein product [Albugo candida]|uniref:Prefoldin subunit 2 n=1 Tax=Albugo candida TaxID=65357 RepID=A0A024GN86_9STRA|nr:unnamed protein product [Albugo candida]|eukprot:CCI48253.1 unnamed protein product [Albugo candida]